MNLELSKIIEQCNSKRSNIYYRLNQLENITGLSTRMLKYRMKSIKEKYRDIPSLLKKVGKSWQIHISIISEFLPIRNHKNRPPRERWQSFGTWNTKDSYTVDYHLELIGQIKQSISPSKIYYVIEEDKRKVKHVHIMSDLNKSDLTLAIESVLYKYINPSEVKLLINTINNKYSASQYMDKTPLASGLI